MLKRLQEIEARKKELLTELEGDVTEERMAQIEAEQAALAQEEKTLRKKLDIRERLGSRTESPEAGNTDSVETRARQFVETRSTTISSGMIAVPSNAQNEVNPTLESGRSILDLVHVADCNGMGSNIIPYEKPGMEAGTSKEGESNSSDFVTDYAEIKPVTVTVYTEVSRETRKLTPVKYLEAVQRAAVAALRKKVAALVVSSDAEENTVFFGINKAKACKDSIKEIDSIGATTLRDIILSYGGDEDVAGAAVLLLTKEDLQAFGAIRGEKEKKPVYEIIPDTVNPNCGVIKDGGLSCRYSLNSRLTAFSKATAGSDVMYYGKPMAYELDIFSDYTLTVSEEAALKSRMIAVLGEVMVGGNVTTYNGFLKIRKKGTTQAASQQEPVKTDEG